MQRKTHIWRILCPFPVLSPSSLSSSLSPFSCPQRPCTPLRPPPAPSTPSPRPRILAERRQWSDRRRHRGRPVDRQQHASISGFHLLRQHRIHRILGPEILGHMDVRSKHQRRECRLLSGQHLPGSHAWIPVARRQVRSRQLSSAANTWLFDVNQLGAAVGSFSASQSVTKGFMLVNGKYTAIAYPNAQLTYAQAINDNGEVAGSYSSGFVSYGFLWQSGTFTNVDYPKARFGTALVGVNDSGVVAGNRFVGDKASVSFTRTESSRTSSIRARNTPWPAASTTTASSLARSFIPAPTAWAILRTVNELVEVYPGRKNSHGSEFGHYLYARSRPPRLHVLGAKTHAP